MLPEIDPKILFFGLVGLAVFIEVAADIFLKRWAMENQFLLLAIGLGIYFVGTIFWALSLKHEYLSKAGAIFTILNLILVVLAGMIFFKEKLSLAQEIGIILGIISIAMIELA